MQGQYYDPEFDLCYNRNRYYDPGTGSFVSADPLGLDAGTNNYAYAPNVWGWIDPLGLMECEVDAPKKVLADNDVLVYAMDKSDTELGQKALKAITNNDVYLTPNQLNEFARFRGISRSQRQARMAFLKSNRIKVLDKPASISKGSDFQDIFTKTAGGQGRGDAALAAFAKKTGIEAVTANSKLVRYLNNSLPPSLRGTVPITNLRH